MDDHEAIELYDRAGRARSGAHPPVCWPDLALGTENLERLAEGVLGAQLDLAVIAFGDDFDAETCGDRLSEAWRTDGLQVRYAPEGVFVRATFTVRLEIAPEPDDDDEAAAETLALTAELCVSFTHRHHTRPFVDFMSGTVARGSDGAVTRLDPFAHEIAPGDAVAWGLNGV